MKETIYKSSYTKLTRDPQTGWEIVHRPDAVAGLVICGNQMLLVKQNRIPVRKDVLEVPAGIVDKGETPLDALVREVREETGYNIGKEGWQYQGVAFSSPGFTDEKIHLYVKYMGRKPNPAFGYIQEFEVVWRDCSSWWDIVDMKTIALIAMSKR